MMRAQNTPQSGFARVLLAVGGLTVAFAGTVYGQESPGHAAGRAAQANSPLATVAAAPLEVAHVQGNVYVIAGAGGNITVQAGDDGVLLVDTGLVSASDRVLAAIRTISAKPIHYIINTHIHPDHVGGNEVIARQGSTITGGNVVGNIGASAAEGATIIAFQTILDRMSAPDSKDKSPQKAWPTDTYTDAEKKLFFNGEAIEIIHQPFAHTDGDSMVFFRRSDVVSTGDIVTMAGYPIIDTERGGTIQGIIGGFNRLIYQITIPAAKQEGGTMVIPGHGRICDQADLVYYQEMLIIVRDRIQNMIDKGMTIEQVQQAKPTRDYDPLYASLKGQWTPDKFVAAIYQNLKDHPEKDEHEKVAQ
ncbi:MAG: MBL fold metallo-hydrolase [Candidatus Acidiferrales bacterium]|jgi:glyoxylase-like metal-dependent hydrolase (beta-lactamase superfamily II)